MSAGAGLFAVYGTGFVAMALTIAALFGEALRSGEPNREGKAGAKGEVGVRLILAGTGIVSILISLTPFGKFAAFAYSTLPLTIGLFVKRHAWTGEETAE